MPRRVMHLQALFALTLLVSVVSSASAAAAGETVSLPVTGLQPRIQEEDVWVEEAIGEGEVWVEEEIVEDEFSSFTMPGLAPDNITDGVLADIDAFWAGELASLGHDHRRAGVGLWGPGGGGRRRLGLEKGGVRLVVVLGRRC